MVSVAQPAKVEEELAKEIEEKVEDVEKVEKEKKVEEVVDYSLAGGGIQNNASKEEPLYFPGVKLEEVKK